jgi:hypothetical protein
VLVIRILGNCPGCGAINKFGNVSVREDYVLRGCGVCQYSEHIPLPPLRKNILYLDQFFFSHAFLQKDRRFVDAAQQISRISADQLLVVPYSSVHEDEAHQWRGYSGKNREDLIKFIKSTSRGHEFEPAYEVERYQMAQAFQAFRSDASPTFSLHNEDALDDNIHAWDDYFWIDVGRYWGNIELARDLKSQSVEALVDEAFPNWRQSTLTFEEQVSVEMRETAKGYLDAYAKYAARLMSGDFAAVWNSPLLSSTVDSLLHIPPPEKPEDRLKQIMRFFTSKHFEEMPYLWLSARIYAVLKDMVKHGAYKKREEAIGRLTGFFQDVQHVSTYAPYCDAFFMDKAMAHIVTDPRINLEGRFGVKIFSVNNWAEFLRWLNDLQAGMSTQHRTALTVAYPAHQNS